MHHQRPGHYRRLVYRQDLPPLTARASLAGLSFVASSATISTFAGVPSFAGGI
ncbi:hypothetical protein NLK61_00555 [Pseudomonas fuscovaginae UPB0736]|uniref:hypothetical protein n=1 Tax=Pseudomonas asplenii TaxID=53407 RepID=UPI00030AD66D|nr:hypothetical protein [Pseudomonas fuscovaginae]UUQ65177.1 hypothetical protein NLK61_00555 [Pseudomonas fuscovaginae UPB0736]